MTQKPDFKTSFLALMEEEGAGDHPAAEALAAYRGGELAAGERAGVGAHLEGCRDCAEMAADLDLFTEDPPSGEGASEFEVAAFLRTLKPQLASPAPVPPEADKWSTGATAWQRPLAMAASLVLAVGVSWSLSRDLTQRAMLAEPSQPWANIEVLDLGEDRSERSGSPARPAEMAADRGGVLILTPDNPGDFSLYEARILDAGGALVDALEVELDARSETFTLLIPPGYLPPGDYRIKIYGLSANRDEVVAVYRLWVVGPEEAPP